jgi:hypothetical protein
MKKNEVARKVRVKLNSNFQIKSLSDRYLACEPILFIDDSHVYNNSKGEYVFIKGGSRINSGIVYLNEVDLEFPITDAPLYSHEHIDYKQDLTMFESFID